jgi:hypothetical protein
MDLEEYGRWQAYFRRRPSGEEAADLRLLIMIRCLFAVHGGEPVELDKLMPWMKWTKADPAALEQKLRLWNETTQAMVRGKKPPGDI